MSIFSWLLDVSFEVNLNFILSFYKKKKRNFHQVVMLFYGYMEMYEKVHKTDI